MAFDMERMRPGCVIVAAALGADASVSHRFDAEDWLVELTPDMLVYDIDEENLGKLVERVRKDGSRRAEK